MITYNMPVSKKNAAKKYETVGTVAVTVPTLADIAAFIASPITGHDTGTAEAPGSGLPIYASKEANWLQDAIFAAVKAGARNKLISETATVKPGLIIPSTWAEFTAESEGNKGEALAIIREAKAAFAAWLGAQGKSDKIMQALTLLFGNRAALKTQGAAQKAKFLEFLEAFIATLDEAQESRFERHLTALMEAATAADDGDDWAA